MATLRDLAVYRISQQLLGEIGDRYAPLRRRALWLMHILEGTPGEMTEQRFKDLGWVTEKQMVVAKKGLQIWNNAIDTAANVLLAFQPLCVDTDTSSIYDTLTEPQQAALIARVNDTFPPAVAAAVQDVRQAWLKFKAMYVG